MLFSITAGLDLTAYAQTLTGSCGENVTYTLDTDSGLLTISGTGPMTDYSSLSSVPWYSNRSSVKTVEIEYGVTSTGDCAFEHCYRLTSVTIGSSVTSIGNRAFYDCDSLTSVTIPDSVTSIGWYAFENCSSLTSITIPDSVTSIGSYAFYNCSSLASVTVSDTCWNKLQIESGNDDLIWAKYGSTITEILSDEVYFDYNENEFEKITNSLLLQKINKKLSSHGITINTNTNTVTINGKVYETSSYVISPRAFYAPYYGIDGRLTIFEHEIAVPIHYKNSDDYNKNDEQYIKNLAISSPKYYEVEFDYLNKNNIWENFFETVNSYYENLINDASVEIKSSSGAGGAEGGLNLSTFESGTVICIFKNGVFYDSRIMGKEIEVPVINVPDTIPESEINSYVINLIEETYPKENRSVSDIIEGTKGFGVDIPDGYTVVFEYVHENGEHDYYESYIIIKKPNSNPPMQNPQDNTSQTTQPAQPQDNTPADTQQGVQSTQSTQDVSVTTQQPNTQPISQVNETTTAAPATTAKKPKSTSIKKLTKGKKSFKITFKKVTGISGYQVQCATDKKFKKNKKTVTVKKSKTSTTVKKLKAGKKYYVRVRTYKTVKGKKVYSTWSKVKTVNTK